MAHYQIIIKMNKLYLSCIIAAFSYISYGQAPDTHCGSMDHLKLVASQNPQYAHVIENNESILNAWIEAHPNDRSTSSTVVIPVVVHVVYNTLTENISDAQIFSEIDTLNVDYMRMNADTVNTPKAFRGVAGNPNVQFCLAQRDPGGYLSTGIVRVKTSHTSFGIDDTVKFTKYGGDDAWPETDYLNLWV